jgi:hypothetical protein
MGVDSSKLDDVEGNATDEEALKLKSIRTMDCNVRCIVVTIQNYELIYAKGIECAAVFSII